MIDSNKVQQARNECAANRKAAGLKTTRTPMEKLADDPKSKAKAIVAKCFDCVGGNGDRCWQWRVGNCDVTDCALFHCRPHRRLKGRPMPSSLIAAGWGEAEQPGETEEQRRGEVDPTASAESETNEDATAQTLPGL